MVLQFYSTIQLKIVSYWLNLMLHVYALSLHICKVITPYFRHCKITPLVIYGLEGMHTCMHIDITVISINQACTSLCPGLACFKIRALIIIMLNIIFNNLYIICCLLIVGAMLKCLH